MKPNMPITLWQRWVWANALGEMIGLGFTFLVAAIGFAKLESLAGLAGILLAFAFAVASGIFEATLVSWAQWWAMRPWFPGIHQRAWWRATVIGALLAYILGYLPSTIMSLQAETTQSTVTEPSQGIVLLLAAGMGLVGGAVLSFAQWLVLRKHARGAGLWLPANMLAWMLGMPMIFWAIDQAQKLNSINQVVPFMAVTLLVVGAVVGAVHGLALVRLALKNQAKGMESFV
ncbi:MAG: hypothetical protein ACYDHA_09700 [Bellilinea sp.]